MKSKIQTASLFFFIVITLSAQKINTGLLQLNIGDKYDSAEITYLDGTKEKGFINGFIESNVLSFSGTNGFNDFEDQLNLDDKKFYWKTDPNSKSKIITQNEVIAVSVDDKYGSKDYRLLNIKTVDKNNEILDLKRKAWLPLLKSDEVVNLYGFNLSINNRYVHTYVYISNDNIDAFKATDQKLPRMETMRASYKTMFQYIFKNCESVNPMIEDFLNVDRWKTERKNTDAEIKIVKKDKTLKDWERDNQIVYLNQKYHTDFYTELIDKYNNSCLK